MSDDGPILTIDPRRQFGRVCIGGTRVPADVVAQCVAAGDSVDATADNYGVTRDQVLLACWWYAEEVSARSKLGKSIKDAWIGDHGDDSWANRALWVLGGHGSGPLEDPPEVKR